MSCCRSLQKQHVIAYLGPAGTFSEMAMQQHYDNQSKKTQRMMRKSFKKAE